MYINYKQMKRKLNTISAIHNINILKSSLKFTEAESGHQSRKINQQKEIKMKIS